MLKDFLYLDENAVKQYVSQIEDGLRSGRSSKTGSTKDRKFGTGSRVPVDASAGSQALDEDTASYEDNPYAQFERLMTSASEDPDELDYFESLQHDADLPAARMGTLIELEADVYIPTMSAALSKAGDLKGTVDALKSMSLIMQTLGKGAASGSMPDMEQMDAVGNFAEQFAGAETFIGELADSEWKIYGQLEDRRPRDDFEGPARVVGKVASILGAGKHKSLLTLPGMNLMSREDKRKLEREGPKPGDEDNWITGPALLLNVVAIYR